MGTTEDIYDLFTGPMDGEIFDEGNGQGDATWLGIYRTTSDTCKMPMPAYRSTYTYNVPVPPVEDCPVSLTQYSISEITEVPH